MLGVTCGALKVTLAEETDTPVLLYQPWLDIVNLSRELLPQKHVHKPQLQNTRTTSPKHHNYPSIYQSHSMVSIKSGLDGT